MLFFAQETGMRTLSLSGIKALMSMMTINRLLRIPQEQVTFSCIFDSQSWGYNGIDQRATSVPVNQEPGFQGGWNPAKSLLKVFKKMVPYKFSVDVVIEQTSCALVEQCLPPLTEGEFLRYIGIWLLVSNCSGWS